MAGIFFDSFDHYGTAQISKKWRNSNGSIDSSFARTGNQSILFDGAQFAFLTIADALSKTMICGTAIYMEVLAGQLMGFSRVEANPLDECFLGVGFGGQLHFVVTFGPGGAIIYEAPMSSALHVRTWYQVEMKVKIRRDATGSIEVRLNGQTIINETNVRTGGTGTEPVTEFAIIGPGGAGKTWHDDTYLCDTSGARNNNFLGDVRNFEQVPEADGFFTGWTPLSGTDHFAMVNEIPPDSNTSYVSADTPGQTDTYLFPLTGATLPITIPCRQALLFAEKDAIGAITVANALRESAMDTSGPTDFSPAVNTYAYTREVYDANPVTGGSWGTADLTLCEMGQVIT